MISVAEAASFWPRPTVDEPEPILASDELRALGKLEGTIDSLIVQCKGMPFVAPFPEPIGENVATALRRKYEQGSWRVQYKVEQRRTSFTFIPTGLSTIQTTVESLPPIATLSTATAAPAAIAGPRLLVRMPTRARPRRALEALTQYRAKAGVPFTLEVILDEDDRTMLEPEILQRLHALGAVITVGRHGSKVAACNAGRVQDWDVLLLASDDMMPVVNGYGVRVLEEMRRYWPHRDGAIYFSDGHQGANCVTLPILGRRLYDQFGYVYNPEYRSLFCDQEQTELLLGMGRLQYVDEVLIEHRHHVWGKAPRDALYERNDALWHQDEAVFRRHKLTAHRYADWPFNAPPLWLSILICTIPSRVAQLERLLDELWSQVLLLYDPRVVEILVDDRETISRGVKRQALLERARGRFVCSIDDDDWPAHDYVRSLVGAIRGDPETDCVQMNGFLTTSGTTPELFCISLKYDDWSSKNGVHYRTPNHLTPVRRDLALKAGFPDLDHGEDWEYSHRLRSLLRREVSTGEKPLYFYWYFPSKEH